MWKSENNVEIWIKDDLACLTRANIMADKMSGNRKSCKTAMMRTRMNTIS